MGTDDWLGQHWLHLVPLNLKQEKGLDAAQQPENKYVTKGQCNPGVLCVLGYLCAMSALTLGSSSIGLNLQAHASAIPFLPKAASQNKTWISVQAEKKKMLQGVCHI